MNGGEEVEGSEGGGGDERREQGMERLEEDRKEDTRR